MRFFFRYLPVHILLLELSKAHLKPYKLLLLAFVLVCTGAQAQVTIRGLVTDESRTIPIPQVSVLSGSGTGTITDSMGRFTITLLETDSIYFSYLNKPTRKFVVSSITEPYRFEVTLRIPVATLNEIRVTAPSYKLDSIQNRKDYAKIFDFRKPGLRISGPSSGAPGVGIDLAELINVFRFQRTKRMLSFQRRLVQEEKDKFIDHRFTKSTVRKLTGLEGKDLDTFMRIFRPGYTFTVTMSEYDFLQYIKLAGDQYKMGIRTNQFIFREEDEE